MVKVVNIINSAVMFNMYNQVVEISKYIDLTDLTHFIDMKTSRTSITVRQESNSRR